MCAGRFFDLQGPWPFPARTGPVEAIQHAQGPLEQRCATDGVQGFLTPAIAALAAPALLLCCSSRFGPLRFGWSAGKCGPITLQNTPPSSAKKAKAAKLETAGASMVYDKSG